jgi:predicted nucleotidyltransferase
LSDELLDLVDGLLYADTFDCALTLDEIRRYARRPVDRGELAERLRRELRDVVSERDGLYCLSGREQLLAERAGRRERARALERRARRVARVLRHAPFVRGLTLTGSVAAGDATARADVDLLVVVGGERLGTVFLLLAPTSRLLGRSLFCPNYYLDERDLASDDGGVYVAHELAQARPIVGGDILAAANPWVRGVFPNAEPSANGTLREGSLLQRLLETPLRGRLGERLERRARRVAQARLRAHYALFGREVPQEVAERLERGIALQFHGKPVKESVGERYEARRREFAQRLAAS